MKSALIGQSLRQQYSNHPTITDMCHLSLTYSKLPTNKEEVTHYQQTNSVHKIQQKKIQDSLSK